MMEGFSIFFIIFGVLIFLAGLYLFTGHDSQLLLWRDQKPKHSKEELRLVGKWTMITSLIPIIIAIIAHFVGGD